ncbi:MAG: ester cyclase [Pseudomonadota bacterium]
MMNRQQIDELIDTHFRFEQTDDIPGVLATLTSDVEHDVVGWPPGPAHGPEAAGGFYERLFADLDDTRITPVRRLYGDDFAVDESLVETTAVGAPFGMPGHGRRIRFRLLHVFEFRDGRIKRENVWLDLAAIQQQLA